MENTKKEFEPLWFRTEKDLASGEPTYIFNDKYFLQREKREWSMCPDLFS